MERLNRKVRLKSDRVISPVAIAGFDLTSSVTRPRKPGSYQLI